MYRDGATAIAIESKTLESAQTMNSESHTRQNGKLTLSIKNVGEDYINSQIRAITSAAGLYKLIYGLPKEYCNKVIDTVADRLVGENGWIKNRFDFNDLLSELEPSQQTIILEKTANTLFGENGWIQKAYQLEALLNAVGSEQQTFILNKLADQLVADSLLNTDLLSIMPDKLKLDVMRRRTEMTEHSLPPGTSVKTNTPYKEIFTPRPLTGYHKEI